MAFKIISPAQLELNLRRLEIRLSEYCGARFKWVTPIAAALLVLIAIGIKTLVEIDAKVLQSFGMFMFVRQGRYALPFLLAGTGLSMFFYRRIRGYYVALISMFAWAINCYVYFLGKVPLDVFLLILFSFPITSIFTFYIAEARRRREPCNGRVIGMLVFFALTWLAIGARLYYLEDFVPLLVFWKFKLHYMLLVAVQLAFAFSPRPVDPFLAFNPVTAAHSILWPVTSLLARRNRIVISRLWWQGFFGVLVGYAIIYAKIQLDSSQLDVSKNLFVKSVTRYILLLMSDIGVFNLITGVARMYGYRVRDATNFSWLARTPAEYWRRGSVYHYEFINRYLYLRLWRLIRVRIVVAFVCFFFFYVMKNGMLDVGIMILNWGGADIHGEFYRNPDSHYSVILFFLHFILLYVSQRHWFFEWAHQREVWKSWASVALTYAFHIGAIAIAVTLNTNGHKIWIALMKMFT